MVLRTVSILLFLNIKCQQSPFSKFLVWFGFFLFLMQDFNRKACVQTQAIHRIKILDKNAMRSGSVGGK